ncbi:MAG: hypothetical protein WDN75_19370 [Bacteroidota bacterium]
MKITIFYSWQSDTEFNKKAIRIALREAMNVLDKQFPKVEMKLDEAVSNHAGARHIPNAILQNITNADVFVGDLSAVGITQGKKILSNPNVLIELGYAISQLGWNRVLILFNRKLSDFTDLPFDMEKRSAIAFSITKDDDTGGIGQLRTSLVLAIKDIIEQNPPRPKSWVEPIDRERANDVKWLNIILAQFNAGMLDQFFKNGASKTNGRIIAAAKLLESTMSSSSFFLNDKKLKKLLTDWRKASCEFEDYLKYYTYFLESNTHVSILKTRNSMAYMGVADAIDRIQRSYLALVRYLRKSYHEINI